MCVHLYCNSILGDGLKLSLNTFLHYLAFFPQPDYFWNLVFFASHDVLFLLSRSSAPFSYFDFCCPMFVSLIDWLVCQNVYIHSL